MKRCGTCSEQKPLTDFNRDRGKRDGLSARCRTCNAAAVRVWTRANPERKRALNIKWAQANPAKVSASQRAYVGRNRESVAVRRNAWAQRNPDKIAATRKRHYERHAERKRSEQRLRRYDDIGQEYVAVLAIDPCCYCGASTEHIDHIIPLAAGGDSHWSNLTAACASCNKSKKDSPVLLFMNRRMSVPR